MFFSKFIFLWPLTFVLLMSKKKVSIKTILMAECSINAFASLTLFESVTYFSILFWFSFLHFPLSFFPYHLYLLASSNPLSSSKDYKVVVHIAIHTVNLYVYSTKTKALRSFVWIQTIKRDTLGNWGYGYTLCIG